VKRNLLIAAAAACLVLPSAGFADQAPQNAPPGQPEQPGQQHPRRARPQQNSQAPQTGQPTPRPGQPGLQGRPGRGGAPPRTQPPPSAPVIRQTAPGPQGPAIRRAPTERRTQPRTQAPPAVVAPPTGGQPYVRRPQPPAVTPTIPARPQARPGERAAPQMPGVRRPALRPPRGTPQLGGWTRDLRGPDRDYAGREWRQSHRDWDRNAPWRRSQDWWRHSRAFRSFFGPRLGFFFIPELGYYAVPSDYEHRYWVAGQYLPQWFWQFEVRDYWNYGLPEPPYGCVWVWVDNDVALIDASDGYILDIVHNVW